MNISPWNCRTEKMYDRRISFVVFVTTFYFVQSTQRFTLITDNKINYSFVDDNNFLQQPISVGIYGLLDFVVNLDEKEERFVSVLSQRRNAVLNEMMTARKTDSDDEREQYKRKFYHFDVDALKMMYADFEEHDVIFNDSFYADIIQLLSGFYFPRICIVSYLTCSNDVVRKIFHKNNNKRVPNMLGVCVEYNPFSTAHLVNLLNSIPFTMYSHVILLVNEFDVEQIMQRFDPVYFTNTHFIVISRGRYVSSKRFLEYFGGKFYMSHLNLSTHVTSTNTSTIENETIRLFSMLFSGDVSDIKRLKTSVLNSLRKTSMSSVQNLSVEEYNVASVTRDHVRVTSILHAPFNMLVEYHKPMPLMQCSRGYLCHMPINNTAWLPACCDGFSMAMFDRISKELDFTYDLYITEDGKFGGFDAKSTWNGMMNELVQNRADIAVQGIEPTNERAKFVKFTPGYEYTYLVFVRREVKRRLAFMNWYFLRNVRTSLATGIVLTTLITTITIALFENAGFLLNSESHFSLREVMTYIFGLTFQRDMGGKNPINWSGRVVALAYATAMLIVMATYAAHIAATSIKNNVEDDFEGLTDKKVIQPTSAFKFAVMADTSTELFFKNSEKSEFKNAWSFMKKYTVQNNSEGIRKVFEGELDAYLSDERSIRPIVSTAKYCSDLTIYREERTLSEVSFAYRNDFVLGEEIFKAILRLKNDVIVKQDMKKWVYEPACKRFNEADTQFDVNYFGGIIIVFGVVLVICVLIILVENLWTYSKINGYFCFKLFDQQRKRTETETSFYNM